MRVRLAFAILVIIGETANPSNSAWMHWLLLGAAALLLVQIAFVTLRRSFLDRHQV